jgi:hypothetical protein
MPLDLTAATSILKTRFTTEEVMNIASAKHPLFANLTKMDDFTGDGTLKIPVEHTNPQAIGGSFTKLQTTAITNTSTKWSTWALTRRLQYGIAKVSGLVMVASADDEGAFFRAADREWRNMFKEMGNRIAVHLYRSGSGSLGQRASISTNTITLSEARDARNFKIGMSIEAAAGDGTGALRVGSTFVTNVDLPGGKITVNSAAGITTFSDNDFLFAMGDHAAVDGGTYHGLAGWLPSVAPAVGGGDNWFGIDRSVNVTLLAGQRKTMVSGQTLEEVGMDLATDIWDVGGTPDCGYLSPQNLNILAKQLGSKIVRQDPSADSPGTFGFPSITQYTDAGPITWYGDPDCPRTRMYILTQDTWTLHHVADFPHYVEEDGNAFLRKDSEDAYETRARAWGNLACRAPGYNGVATLL